MSQYQTVQEEFWAGKFGTLYSDRNEDNKLLASNISLFSKILNNTCGITSVMELGANIGLNLIALKSILPDVKLSAVEINKNAFEKLENISGIDAYNESILNFTNNKKYDFVLSKGVLIHINPAQLSGVYKLMYEMSNKYLCIVEYYNPTPTSVNYRGQEDRLFKRDFAGEIIDSYVNLSLVDYGFVYHRDNNFAQDDVTWFLLEKK